MPFTRHICSAPLLTCETLRSFVKLIGIECAEWGCSRASLSVRRLLRHEGTAKSASPPRASPYETPSSLGRLPVFRHRNRHQNRLLVFDERMVTGIMSRPLLQPRVYGFVVGRLLHVMSCWTTVHLSNSSLTFSFESTC